jgi:hypothetical protein
MIYDYLYSFLDHFAKVNYILEQRAMFAEFTAIDREESIGQS